MSAAVPFVILLQCHYCPRQVHPREVVNIGDDALMCWTCWEKHKIAVESFHPPHECAECQRTFAQIAADTIGNQVRMYPHWKDGLYQILCVACDEIYVQKRKDLYRKTEFGWERKLS